MKKSIYGLIIIFILLTTYKPKFSFTPKFNINVQEIIIENNSFVQSKEIKQKLSFLYDENLLFLNIRNIEASLKKISFIDSFIVKKIYPYKLKLIIKEKKPIAILNNKKGKFYIIKNGDIIKYRNLGPYKNLPTVFGNGNSFHKLYKDIINIKFPLESIKSFYFFESGRWDLNMNDDKVLKLPIKNYLYSLKDFMKSKNNNNFNKYKTFDYRIKDQLILN
jgi:cell division septal protein FtsQ